jgi:TonB-linked SusC/RagA family outer membrane protein
MKHNVQLIQRFLWILLLVVTTQSFAQTTTVSGKVTDMESGEALVGVNVFIKGTQTGTITDINGEYSLPAESNDVLVFSYVGYVPEEVAVGNQTNINIGMALDLKTLGEVVVIGYGSIEEKDLTSAISTVDSEIITKTPTAQPMQALQGRVPGLQIVSNGAPGGDPTVRIRGIGSFEDSGDPLYVVDGMFFDDIDFLNPSDIKTISVLKDASASAIYGVRAANGVILIETKSGSYNQKAEIVYDGYFGIQNPQNVLKMANTEQFVQYINEVGDPADLSFIDEAMQRYGRSRVNPDLPAINTDWYAEIMSPAPIQNHSLSFNGGNENTRYSIGGSFFSQDGLLNETRNEFKRLNFRTKVDADLNNWLTVGTNVNVSVGRRYDGSNASWFSAYHTVPTMPKIDEQNDEAYPVQLSNARMLGYRGRQNPFYSLLYNDNRNNIAKIMGNFYADITLIPDKLTFRTQYNYGFENFNNRTVNFEHFDGEELNQSSISRNHFTSFDQIFNNVFTYRNGWGNHNLTFVLGQEYRSEYNELLRANATELSPTPNFDNEHLWYLDRGLVGPDAAGDTDGRTIFANLQYLSFFGRIAYNYDDRYLFYTTYRADGSNKFQNDWTDFITFGGGWVITEENFFDVNGIDFLKIRGSWGQLGNDDVRPAAGEPTLDIGRLTVINGAPVEGRVPNPVFDFVDQPETVEETNIGITARFLNDRLSVEADYFIRDSKNSPVVVEQPLIRGAVRRSFGSIRNSGFELVVNWNGNLGSDFTYNIGGNLATLQNEVLDLGGPQFLQVGGDFVQRSTIGQPYLAFYGYEVEGVFQNQSDIDNSGYTQEFIDNAFLVPGDLKFRDQNGDGEINDEDRVVLGSFLPELSYGFNIGFSYRNIDFSAFFQGQAGHEILNRKRGELIYTNDTNLDAELIENLWRGEGTSNKYPSAAGLRKGWNQNFSSYYIEDGSFFRIQNVQLAYNIVGNEIGGKKIPDFRIILTAERPLTVFNYNGFNPEVANGIDRQVYPIPAVYTLGLNMKF